MQPVPQDLPMLTILLNFMLNANLPTDLNARPPKVVLADMHICDYLKHMTIKYSISDLTKLLHELNYIDLIEKLRFAQS